LTQVIQKKKQQILKFKKQAQFINEYVQRARDGGSLAIPSFLNITLFTTHACLAI
jgi:hypothetical protein